MKAVEKAFEIVIKGRKQANQNRKRRIRKKKYFVKS